MYEVTVTYRDGREVRALSGATREEAEAEAAELRAIHTTATVAVCREWSLEEMRAAWDHPAARS